MRESNRTLFSIVALVLMTALVWLSFGVEDEEPTADQAPPVREPQARYYATDITLRSFDDGGRPGYELTAPRVAYFADDDAWRMQQPRWRSLGAGDDWHGRARHGVLTATAPDRHRLRLTGDVRLRRAAPRPLTLRTEALTVVPERDYAETRAEVTVEAPLYRVRARGARAWLDQERVELLADVRGTYASD